MSLWLILGAMTLLALGLALAPLVRGAGAASSRREHNLAVYRAQLEELRQERERGLLGEREAEAAELEIKRRMLAADAEQKTGGTRASHAGRRATAIAVLIGLPLLSALLYGLLGSPGQPGAPFAGRAGERTQMAGQGTTASDERLASVEAMIARLEALVEEQPEDLEGWVRLGRAYALTNRYGDAAEAYRRALAIRDDAPELHAAFAEAAITAAGGVATEAARASITRALELDPDNVRARFYQGLVLLQRGEREQALDTWVGLLREAPADAPWLPTVRQRVRALAEDMGRDPDVVMPEVAQGPAGEAGPTPEQRRAPADMAPEEREQMIRGMVEGLAARLEEQPDDVEGWKKLVRSYRVLEEPEKAAEAAGRVAALLPEDAAAQLDYARALLALEASDAPLSSGTVAQLRRVLELDEDNPQALFFLGRAAAERGELERAEDYWQQLLAQIPEDAPQRQQLEDLIERLRASG